MEKLKSFRMPMWLSLCAYVVAFLLAASVLSSVTFGFFMKKSDGLYRELGYEGERYYLTNEKGEKVGGGVEVYADAAELSGKEKMLEDLYSVLPGALSTVYAAVGIGLAVYLFYRSRLRKPISELREASERISQNDLDISITYSSKDELGQLCGSFNKMSDELSKSFTEMWRKVEERRRLNRAFAHDLRTPLTILKGYTEMLQLNCDDSLKKTAEIMDRQVNRLQRNIETMSAVQRMEDAKPALSEVGLNGLVSELRRSSEMVCSDRGIALEFKDYTLGESLPLDSGFVAQVFGNLLSNAVRFADESVTVTVLEIDAGLKITVEDDGLGFDPESLAKATDPYFTMEDRSEHFGLGLYISRILCESHGGYIKVANSERGGRTEAFFGVSRA